MKNVKTACLIAALTGLYGCGGGGGGSSSLDLTSLQGVWDSSSLTGTDLGANTKAVRSVMFKDGTAWVFLLDDLISPTTSPTPIGLVKASVAVSGQNFSGTGKHYFYTPGNISWSTSSIEVQGNVPASQQLALKFGAAATPTTLTTLAPVTRFNATAASAKITGNWESDSTNTNNGATTTYWNIDSAGTLSGYDTKGCDLTGQVLPRSEPIAVFNVNVTFTCGEIGRASCRERV